MTVNKRKKNTRLRGSKTHGGGAKKKRRGSGNRGGCGMGGSGKRADSKKPTVQKIKGYFGKFGFKFHGKKEETCAINAGELEKRIYKLVQKGLVTKEKDKFTVNMTSLGYTKLLGGGFVTIKMIITVNEATESAITKIQKAGGTVTTNIINRNDESKKEKEE